MKFGAFVIFLLLYFLMGSVSASYLRISQQSNLHISQLSSEILLSGIYTIENEGDEPAQNIFPVFFLDRSRLQLEPQTAYPRRKISWDLQWRIPIENICTEIWNGCLTALPSKGQFLIRILQNYQDRNGLSISAPSFLIISSDKKIESEAGLIEIQLEKSTKQSHVDKLEVHYTISNRGSRETEVSLRTVISPQLKLITELGIQPLKIQSHARIEGYLMVEKQRGETIFESVLVLAAEWKVQMGRRAEAASLVFRFNDSKIDSGRNTDILFWRWLGIFLAFGLIAMWVFWIRPLGKL